MDHWVRGYPATGQMRLKRHAHGATHVIVGCTGERLPSVLSPSMTLSASPRPSPSPSPSPGTRPSPSPSPNACRARALSALATPKSHWRYCQRPMLAESSACSSDSAMRPRFLPAGPPVAIYSTVTPANPPHHFVRAAVAGERAAAAAQRFGRLSGRSAADSLGIRGHCARKGRGRGQVSSKRSTAATIEAPHDVILAVLPGSFPMDAMWVGHTRLRA